MGDVSFSFSFARTQGLTAAELTVLQDAQKFFGLPLGEGPGKIAGVMILPDGRRFAFISGKVGGPQGGAQAGFLPRGPGSGVTRYNVTHIEAHGAATLHRVAAENLGDLKVGEAALLIPKPPCGACDPNIPSMLPKGSRLFVVDPNATTVYQSSSGLKVEGLKFPREADHFFGGVSEPHPWKPVGAGTGAGITRPGAGTVLLIWPLGVFIDVLHSEQDRADLQAKQEALEAGIRAKIPGLLLAAADMQNAGAQPFLGAGITVKKTTKREIQHPLAPPKERDRFEFRLNWVRLIATNLNSKTASTIDEPILPWSDRIETWDQTISFPLDLPKDFADAVLVFRALIRWFEDAAANAANKQREGALNAEREKLQTDFQGAVEEWGKKFAAAPPAPFHPAPAAGVSRPLLPPPTPPPPPASTAK